MNCTVTLLWAAVPTFVNLACGLTLEPVWITPLLAGMIRAEAAMSLVRGATPENSSAPISGGELRASMSISTLTPRPFAPPDSNLVEVPFGMCRFELLVTGGAIVATKDALSLVPEADNALVYARRFDGGFVEDGSKLAA